MKKKNWKELNVLIYKCYESLVGLTEKENYWQEAFDLLIKVINEERKENANFAIELYKVGEETDYICDIDGWIEDYFDYLDINEKYNEMVDAANQLLDLFKWIEDSPSTFCYRKASALARIDRCDEAITLCEEWLKKESDNPLAAASSIYSYLSKKDVSRAEHVADNFWDEKLQCTFDTEPFYTAALTIYGISGNTEMVEKCQNKLEKFEEWLKEFMGIDEDDQCEEELF